MEKLYKMCMLRGCETSKMQDTNTSIRVHVQCSISGTGHTETKPGDRDPASIYHFPASLVCIMNTDSRGEPWDGYPSG